MNEVVFTCPFVPAELIKAAGLEPVRLCFDPVCDPHLPRYQGMCPYAHAFVNNLMRRTEMAAAIFTTTCDQMHRAHELFTLKSTVPAFLLDVPATWQSQASRRYFVSELNRFKEFLEHICRHNISTHDAITGMRHSKPMPHESPDRGKISIGLLGGHVFAKDFKLGQILNDLDCDFGFDGSCWGDRSLSAPIDLRHCGNDPIMEIAASYFSIPDVFRRPNWHYYDWLGASLQRSPVRGLILLRYTFCDLWHAEANRIKQFVSVPVLDLILETPLTICSEQAKSRIEAFVEMLK